MKTPALPRVFLTWANVVTFLLSGIGLGTCIWCVVDPEYFTIVHYAVIESSYVAEIPILMNLTFLRTPISYILISSCCLAMFTSFFGMVGAGCKIKCAIKYYIHLVAVIFLVHSTIALFIYCVFSDEDIKMNLKTYVQNYYGNRTDLVTYAFDYVMVNYNCCGVINSQDFLNMDWLVRNENVSLPAVCCNTLECPDKTVFEIKAEYPVVNGCFSTFERMIGTNYYSLIGYVVSSSLFFCFIILFAYFAMNEKPFAAIRNVRRSSIPPEVQPEVLIDIDKPQKVARLISKNNPNKRFNLTYVNGGGVLKSLMIFPWNKNAGNKKAPQ